MKLNSVVNIKIDPSITVLSDSTRIFKSELFIKQTKNLKEIDRFLTKISDGILIALKDNVIDLMDAYIISLMDGQNSLLFKFGKNVKNDALNQADIVFYKFITKDEIKYDDKRLVRAIQKDEISIDIKKIQDLTNQDIQKLYILSNEDKVNLPLLNKEQEKLVTLENDNIIIQGVAGSGKTNICIDRIVYSASRRYRGKILYSTYSHALLQDTKNKVSLFNSNIKDFAKKMQDKKVVFIGKNKKAAIENRLGIWLDVQDEDRIIAALFEMSNYLETKVDYMLIEDLYNAKRGANIIFEDEKSFINSYINNIKNYNLKSSIDKIKYLSFEVIYKEIYGLILGYANMPTQEEYVELRKDSFSSQEASTIYLIAKDYLKYLESSNKIDNNIASRYILSRLNSIDKYSLCVLDEVQDFTQINLNMFREISYKMFCVGDALQMINPAYFSFAYLKRLMFDENYANVVELRNNYRNSKKIEKIVDNLSELNIEQFGTHSFVLRGRSVDDELLAKTVYINSSNFIQYLKNKAYSDVTLVVDTKERKQALRAMFPRQEILTISEIKGLERNFVILLDVLSDNSQKWDYLQRTIIKKKKAEENSVYRYYFNLFYVGLTRAKQNLFVVEGKNINLFKNFFDNNFDALSDKAAFDLLESVASKVDLDRQEIIERIEEFIRHEQYDNARVLLERLDKDDAHLQSVKIDIYEKYIRRNQNREAGIEFWKMGLLDDAKEQFRISHDDKLITLLEACESNGSNLEYDIVEFYNEVKDNDIAKNLILDTLKDDLNKIKSTQQTIINSIHKRRTKYGK